HSVVFTTSFQRSFTSKGFFVVVADVGAGHVLVLHGRDALTNFFPLNTGHVRQHAFVAEVACRQVVGGQRSGVVGRQRDQVVEDTRFTRRVALEVLGPLVRFGRQFAAVVVGAHQFGAVVGRHVLAFFL